MIVGENTRSLTPDVVYRELDRVIVKGSEQPVTIYEPIGRQGEVDAARHDALQLWAQFLRLYRSGEWDKAELQLLNLQKVDSSQRLYELFMERVSDLRNNPPAVPWDGAARLEAK